MSDRVLFTEGYFDKQFYSKLLEVLNIRGVDVKKPSETDRDCNGKHNAIDIFSSLVINLNDQYYTKLCLIVDADFTGEPNEGFHKTLAGITRKLGKHGYNRLTNPTDYRKGIIFRKTTKYPDIGIWIMPNNSGNGFIESLLFQALREVSTETTNEAERVVSNFINKVYHPNHEEKAMVAVFLAMQKHPGRNNTLAVCLDSLCKKSFL